MQKTVGSEPDRPGIKPLFYHMATLGRLNPLCVPLCPHSIHKCSVEKGLSSPSRSCGRSWATEDCGGQPLQDHWHCGRVAPERANKNGKCPLQPPRILSCLVFFPLLGLKILSLQLACELPGGQPWCLCFFQRFHRPCCVHSKTLISDI